MLNQTTQSPLQLRVLHVLKMKFQNLLNTTQCHTPPQLTLHQPPLITTARWPAHLLINSNVHEGRLPVGVCPNSHPRPSGSVLITTDILELSGCESTDSTDQLIPMKRDARYTDFSPHSQFAPFFSETFRPQLILRKDVSPPPHKYERRFARVFIVQEDVSHPNHISERRFAAKPYFRKTFRIQTIF